MGINFKWIGSVVKLIPIISGAVQAVESLKNLHGKDKQDAAVNAIEAMIPSFQLALPDGLFRSDEFQALLRTLIDDYVAIQNFIAKTHNGNV